MLKCHDCFETYNCAACMRIYVARVTMFQRSVGLWHLPVSYFLLENKHTFALLPVKRELMGK